MAVCINNSLIDLHYDIFLFIMAIPHPQVVLITGSTDGIGKQTAIELAKLGYTVLVHGRSKVRAFAAASDICKESGTENIEVVTGDLSTLAGVRVLAERVLARYQQLNILINNAGVFMKERVLNADGFEMSFAVNYVAPFLLTHLLLERLESSATTGAKSRIVNVSSIAHQRATLDFGNLKGEKHFDGFNAYALTKLAEIMMTFEFAERLAGKPVTVNCLHPGVVTTKLLQAGFGTPGGEVAAGAETSVYLASSPEVEDISGKYFVKKQITQPSQTSLDVNLRKHLWKLTEEFVGLRH